MHRFFHRLTPEQALAQHQSFTQKSSQIDVVEDSDANGTQ